MIIRKETTFFFHINQYLSSPLKKLPLIVLSIILGGIFFSCDCKNETCEEDDIILLSVVSADTGEDLIYGENQQLRTEDVKMYYLNKQKEKVFVSLGESLSHIYPLLNATAAHEYFIETSRPVEATFHLVIDYMLEDSECCGNTTKILSAFLDENLVDKEEGNNILFIKLAL